jgi:hypothetical protein
MEIVEVPEREAQEIVDLFKNYASCGTVQELTHSDYLLGQIAGDFPNVSGKPRRGRVRNRNAAKRETVFLTVWEIPLTTEQCRCCRLRQTSMVATSAFLRWRNAAPSMKLL